MTALYKAVQSGDIALIERFLQVLAEAALLVDKPWNLNEYTPFHIIVKTEQTDVEECSWRSTRTQPLKGVTGIWCYIRYWSTIWSTALTSLKRLDQVASGPLVPGSGTSLQPLEGSDRPESQFC
jgi:hypothetical protein